MDLLMSNEKYYILIAKYNDIFKEKEKLDITVDLDMGRIQMKASLVKV